MKYKAKENRELTRTSQIVVFSYTAGILNTQIVIFGYTAGLLMQHGCCCIYMSIFTS